MYQITTFMKFIVAISATAVALLPTSSYLCLLSTYCLAQ